MPENEGKKKSTSTTEKVVASIMTGTPRAVITFGVGHPFDLLKTRMQANPYIHSSVLLSKEIFEKTGIKGFYVAGLPNFTRHIAKTAYRDPMRGYFKARYMNSFPDANAATIAAATSFTMSTADTYLIAPLERFKVWKMNSKTSGATFFQSRPEGAKAAFQYYYRGAHISWVRSSLSWTTYLVPEAIIREKVIQSSPRILDKDNKNSDIPLAEQIFIGALGGLVNGICTLPFDSIKTNIQKPESTVELSLKEMMNVGKGLIKEHGIYRGLYAGFYPRLLHYSIVGVLTEGVMHNVDKIWADHVFKKS